MVKITDLIGACLGWYYHYKREWSLRRRPLEDRLRPYFMAAASDPLAFLDLLENIRGDEIHHLHRHLGTRVTYFGTILSGRDREALDTLVWSRNTLARLYPQQCGTEQK